MASSTRGRKLQFISSSSQSSGPSKNVSTSCPSSASSSSDSSSSATPSRLSELEIAALNNDFFAEELDVTPKRAKRENSRIFQWKRIPPEILPTVFAYIPNHMNLRLINREADRAVQILHSMQICTDCACHCKSPPLLSDMMLHRMPWMKEWKVDLILTDEEVSIPRIEDSKSMQAVISCLSQGTAKVVRMDFTLVTNTVPSSRMLTLDRHQELHFARWCAENSIPDRYQLFTSINSVPTLHFAAAMKSTVMDRIHSMTVRFFPALASCAHTNGMRTLKIAGMDAAAALSFSQSQNFRHLKELQLSHCKAESLIPIIQSPLVSNIQKLTFFSLDGNVDELLERVSDSGHLKQLVKLTVSHCTTLTNAGIQHLTSPSSIAFKNLRELDLNCCPLDETAFKLLASPESGLKSLQHLDLSNATSFATPMQTLDAIKALCESENFQFLTRLVLSRINFMTPECAKLLASSRSALPRLQSLIMDGTRIGGTGVLSLYSARSLLLPHLSALSLRHLNLTNCDFQTLINETVPASQLRHVALKLPQWIQDRLKPDVLLRRYPTLTIE